MAFNIAGELLGVHYDDFSENWTNYSESHFWCKNVTKSWVVDNLSINSYQHKRGLLWSWQGECIEVGQIIFLYSYRIFNLLGNVLLQLDSSIWRCSQDNTEKL